MNTRFFVCLLALPALASQIDAAPEDKIAKDSPEVAAERRKIVGKWAMYRRGKEDELICILRFHEDGMCSVLNADHQLSWRNKYAFNPTATPKQLDHPDSGGGLMPGIYELDGDTMKLCLRGSFAARPAAFKEEDGARLFTLKRVADRPDEKKAGKK